LSTSEVLEVNNEDQDAENILISVIIPAYKVASHIRPTLDSVFTQTLEPDEVILINDGSPDTEQLEIAIKPYLDRLVYLKQQNCGAAAARNAGIRRAKGSYVAFLDADDSWYPTYLEEQLTFLKSNGGYDVVYANALIVDSEHFSGRTYMDISPSVGSVTFSSLVTQQCGVITSGLIARKDLIIKVGLFDETLKRAHDYDLWLRLAKAGARFNYQKKVLLKYRYHEGGLSGDAITQAERDLIVLKKTLRRTDLTPDERRAVEIRIQQRSSNLLLERGKLQLMAGEFIDAVDNFKKANDQLKSWKLRLVLYGMRFSPRSIRWAFQKRINS
jgi:glycosyltransferase involved in cell wall biosynthesis